MNQKDRYEAAYKYVLSTRTEQDQKTIREIKGLSDRFANNGSVITSFVREVVELAESDKEIGDNKK